MARKHKRKNASSETTTTNQNATTTDTNNNPSVTETKSPAKKRSRSTVDEPQQQQQKSSETQTTQNKKQKLSNTQQQQQQQNKQSTKQQKQKNNDNKNNKKSEERKSVNKEDTSSATTAVPISNNNSEFSWSAFDHIIAKEKNHTSSSHDNHDDSDDSDNDSDQEENDNNEEEEEGDKHKNKILKAQQKRHNEHLIAEREKELTMQNVLPETDNDYERLLAGSPNNSFLWIQFMAFKLANTDIEAARSIAERALKKIHFKEDQEKFNIFAALMNLESKFGDEESQRKVFNRAVQYCEAKDVYLQQAKIHEQNGEEERAHDTYKKMMKKFFKSRRPYEAYQQYLVELKQYKRANEILERALKNLPKHKHLKAISKFALIHYKSGSVIDGHQIFEQLVSNYPKRTDIWSMYIDAEMNAERMDQVRNLYERVVHLNLSTKKMQGFLKRYLRFEKDQQSEDGQEHVKQLAREYIALKTSAN